jgi:hypothetical protein
LHRHITPGVSSWIGVTAGVVRGLNLNYWVLQDQCLSELYIDRGKGLDQENKSIFHQIEASKADIEAAFGHELIWQRLDGKRACRITATLPGGYKSPEEDWDDIQTRQVDAMNRLNAALQPYLKTLRLGY